MQIQGNKMRKFAFYLLTILLIFQHQCDAKKEAPIVKKAHGLALYGEPKYGPDFKHFDYTNPLAPKGGTVRLGTPGTFDNLNPFIITGVAATGIISTYASLMSKSDDEPFTVYCYAAKNIEIPEDRSWIIFNLRDDATFHDGSPITAEDIAFSIETHRTKGLPLFRTYFAGIDTVEILGKKSIKFTFKPGANRELPLIIGADVFILSKKYYEKVDFTKTTLVPPLGSGPYKIKNADPGRSITYERVKKWWGEKLPANKGQYNFDIMRYDYYRDNTVSLEAFKAGDVNFRSEIISRVWATGYNFPAVKKGHVILEKVRHENPMGLIGFIFNTRKPIFKDPKVRQALAYAFDFEWSNKNFFYNYYTRSKSFFNNSIFASSGLPNKEELEILTPYKDKLPKEVFSQEYSPPKSDGSGNIRENLSIALSLLKEAGWVLKDHKLVNKKTGDPMKFEILTNSPAFEKIILAFIRNLELLGVEGKIRVIDTAQYQNIVENFEFDLLAAGGFAQSSSPGNEQRNFWGSEAADFPGSRNLAGIKNSVVDALVEQLTASQDWETLLNTTHALDRVLLWGHYVIPMWYYNYYRLAYWNMFGHPKITPKYSIGFDTWWIDPKLEKKLDQFPN